MLGRAGDSSAVCNGPTEADHSAWDPNAEVRVPNVVVGSAAQPDHRRRSVGVSVPGWLGVKPDATRPRRAGIAGRGGVMRDVAHNASASATEPGGTPAG